MKVKINDVNIRNILKNIGLFRVSKRNNKVLTFDDFFNLIVQNKDNDEIIYEILPDNIDKEKEAKDFILNLHLDEEIESFFINQIKFKTGKYSYKDIYTLINYYLNKLSNENIPYTNIYPIIIEDKTYIDNIALFIACLKLDLKPALIDKNFIAKIDENALKPEEHGLYICSSGTSFQKLLPLNFENILSKYSSLNSDHKIRKYSTVTIKGILGLYTNILMPLIDENTIVINDYSNFFYNVDKYNINICYLPTNFEELLNDDVGKLKFSQLKKCVFAGGYLNYNALNKLGKMKEKIIQVYGQTEQSGYISQCKYKDMKKIDLAFSDLLYISFLNADDNELCDIEGLTFFLKFRYSNPSVYTLNHLKRRSIPFLSVGKANSKFTLNVLKKNRCFDCVKEIYQPFLKNIETGEIFYDGNPTGDIGLKYNGNLYVLYRKGNFDSLLKNHFKETLKIDCQIQVINGKKYVIFDDCMDVSKLAHIYMYFCYNIKIMKVLNIETIPLFAKLNRSKGLRKIIKLNEKCELKKFEHDEKCIYLENKLNECIEFDEGFSGSPDFPGIIVKKDNKYFLISNLDIIHSKRAPKYIELLETNGIEYEFEYRKYQERLLEFCYYYGPLINITDNTEDRSIVYK